MTLMRQARKGNTIQQEPAVEMSVGPELLLELRAVAGQVRDLRTVLMGSGEPTGETQYGRIPMLESDMKETQRDVATKASSAELQLLRVDVDALKSARVTGLAHWSIARVAWTLIAGLIIALAGGGFEAFIAWVLLRH